MLRISVSSQDGVTNLIIEGKFAGDGVSELEKCWQKTVGAQAAGLVSVDLARVTFADARGLELLKNMSKEGVQMTGSSLLAECIREQIRKAAQGK
jgi:anti-anti-sigma regulatory factor